ncbi:MAG: hypothetical protein ACERKN_19170 [Velocimicrobium sp.]
MDKFTDLTLASKLECVYQFAKKEKKLSDEIIHLRGDKRKEQENELDKVKQKKDFYWSIAMLSLDMIEEYDLILMKLHFYEGWKWDIAYARAQIKGYRIGEGDRKHLIRLLTKISNEELDRLLKD